jgi:predicted ABC-type sugar transport system permease subunit
MNEIAQAAQASAPVGVSVTIIQVIKSLDPQDKLKRFYAPISLVVGLVIGVFYGMIEGHTKAPELIMDGITNAAYTALAWVVKESTGIKIPGDSGTGVGK